MFLKPDGTEVDRIVGFRGTESILHDIRAILGGQTTAAAVTSLRAGRGHHEDLKTATRKLIEQSRYRQAISLIRLFHFEGVPSCCSVRLFQARCLLQKQVYDEVVEALVKGAALPELPEEADTGGLRRVLTTLEKELGNKAKLAETLRAAKREDVRELLTELPVTDMNGNELYDAAGFAFEGGNYEAAARIYARAFNDPEVSGSAWRLRDAALALTLAGIELETARAWAGKALELGPSPWTAEPLARVFYLQGKRSHAIELVRTAAKQWVEQGVMWRAAEQRRLLSLMRASKELPDRPPFETYPKTLTQTTVSR